MDGAETYSSSGPVCPYCGHNHGDTEPGFFNENLDEMDCDKCGRHFLVSVYISVSWTCERIEQESRP